MKKLKLDVETLLVEGFATVAPEVRMEGTVEGHLATLRCTNLCTEIGSCGHVCP